MQKSSLYSAYNRLDEAHRAWHTAMTGYHRIDDFRAGINTAIQALRNITFALQNQKEQLPNFDAWYASWQMKMTADVILKALSAARTVIVHQKDLKLHSTAIARTKGWIDLEKAAFSFNPMEDSYSMAKGFYNVYARYSPVAEEIKHRLVFEFERKWVYDKLPDYELLEAISHAYHFFHEMLIDAEREFSLPNKTDFSIRDVCRANLNDRNKLKCMVITPQERCLTLSFKEGEILETANLEGINRESVDVEKARQRYGNGWKSKSTLALLEGLFPDIHPYDQVKLYAQVAISNLKKDKYLVPMTFIFKKNDRIPIMISHTFENQEQKVLAIDKVASEILKNNAEYVLFIGEIWQYVMEVDGNVPPTLENAKGTKELIQISFASANEIKIVGIPFYKNVLGKIIFLKAEARDYKTNEEHENYILIPLVNALKEVATKSGS